MNKDKPYDFSDARIVDEQDGITTYKIKGRQIKINSAPNYQDEKRRRREDTPIDYSFAIPEEFKNYGRGKYYKIETYGCQMNENDSETMKGLLEQMGYQEAEDRRQSDLILLNTCAVRENAEDKVFGELGHMKALKSERPGLIVGVCGCMPQEETVINRILQKHNFVDIIFGTHNIHRLPFLLRDAYFNKEMVVEVWSQEGSIIENLPKKREGIKASVNIMYGCDKFCTYCIVPYTRGKERSRRPEDIVAEVRQLAAEGFQEVMLLGQNVNAYGKDLSGMNYRFSHLLDDISKIDIPRIRFTTSHPTDFDDRLIEILAKRGNLMEHIHLPVQSGSSEILKLMGRKYSREQYLDLVRRIRHQIPDVVLTTDIIVGFPGETEQQFQETLSLVDQVGFDAAFTFIYSAREGTPAARMADDVPLQVKKERLYRLNQQMTEFSRQSNEALNGQIVEVLVEGESKFNPKVLAARTRTNKLVHFEGEHELIGQRVQVKITEPQSWLLKGERYSIANRQQIIDKARELADYITQSTEVEIYRKAEQQVAVHEHVQSLIKVIKKKQKEAVAFEQTFKNASMVAEIDEEIRTLQEQLESIPIVAEYQLMQEDLNEMMQMTIGAIRDTISNQIEVEQGKAEAPVQCD